MQDVFQATQCRTNRNRSDGIVPQPHHSTLVPGSLVVSKNGMKKSCELDEMHGRVW